MAPPLSKSVISSGVLKVGRHERFIDDLTGQPLPPELCRKARATEFEYFKEGAQNAYESEVARGEARELKSSAATVAIPL